MFNSSNCSKSTGDGAWVIGSAAFAVLGNAIVSRKLSRPANNITNLSNPNAHPPCGGTPYSNASSKKPNCS